MNLKFPTGSAESELDKFEYSKSVNFSSISSDLANLGTRKECPWLPPTVSWVFLKFSNSAIVEDASNLCVSYPNSTHRAV